MPEMWSSFVKHTIAEKEKSWRINFITDEMWKEDKNTPYVSTITGETTFVSD